MTNNKSFDLPIQSETFSVQDFKLTLTKSEIDKLESLYKDLIDNSKLDLSLSRYENHFKAFYNSLTLVVKNENDLHDKLIVFKRENKELNLKLSQAYKLASIDLKVKENLIEKLEKTSVDAAIALSKQKSAQKTVNVQKVEILNLLNLSEQNAGLSLRQNYNLNELKKENQQLKIENDSYNEKVDQLKSIIEDLRLKENQSVKFVEEAREKIEKEQQEQLKLNLDINRLSRKNEQLESEFIILKASIEAKDFDLASLNQSITSLRVEVKSSEKTIKDLQLHLDNYKKLNNIENIRYQELRSDNEELGRKVFALTKENRNLVVKNEQNENLINELEQKLVKAQEKRDIIERKSKLAEDQKLALESQKITYQLQLESIQKKLKVFELEKDKDRRQIETLIHEKEKLCLESKNLKLNKDNSKENETALKKRIKAIESEKLDTFKQVEKLQKVAIDFDKERNEFVSNLNESILKANNLNNQVKMQEIALERSKKTLKTFSLKLEEIQQTLNLSRKESNFNSKNFSLLKEEFKRTKINLEKYIALEMNTKTVLNRKETEISGLKNEKEKLEILIGQLRKSLSEKDIAINDLKAKLNSLSVNENNLLKIIKETEKDLKSQKEIYLKCKNDFFTLFQSLLLRNHQVGFLYEQLEFMRKTLKEGEVCYERKIEQINSCKVELNKFKKENEILRSQKNLIKILKEELDSKKDDLIVEKAKTEANDKLHKSLNIHRWRKLKGCDPTNYLLILKINHLQKRLILKSEQVAEIQLKFIEKDKLFMELKKCMASRLLTEETSKVLENRNQLIMKQSRQLKASLAENAMVEKLNSDLRQKITELQNKCDEFKTKYFLIKSKFFHKDK